MNTVASVTSLMSDMDLSVLPQYMTTCYPFVSDDVIHSDRVNCDLWNTQWPMTIKSDDVACFDSAEQYRLNGVQLISSSSNLSTSPCVEHHRILHRDLTSNCWRNEEFHEKSPRLANIECDYVTRYSQQNGGMTRYVPFQELAAAGYRFPHVCMNKVSVGVQSDFSQGRHQNSCTSFIPTRRKTIICKDCEVQTDFPDEWADKSLVERPSSMYLSVDSRRDNFMNNQICNVDVSSTFYNDYPVNSNLFTLVPRDPAGHFSIPGRLEQTDLTTEIVKPSSHGWLKSTWGLTRTAGSDMKPSDCSSKTQVSVQTTKQLAVPPSSKKVATKTGSAKDSRTAKKKQKREAQLSRAADVELAEISLEQQVLQQLTQRRLSTGTSAAGSSSDWVGMNCALLEVDLTNIDRNVDTQTNEAELLSPARLDVDDHCISKAKKPSNLKKVILKERESHELSPTCDTPLSASSDVPQLNLFHTSCSSDFMSVDCTTGGSSKTSSYDYQFGINTSSSSIADLSPVSQNSPLTFSTPSASPLSSGLLSPSACQPMYLEMRRPVILNRIHSRRFREYCNQVLSREIDDCCTQLLQHLVQAQNNAAENFSTAVAKRRTVLGLREVTKYLKLGQLAAVIISPNMEKIQSKGGLDEALHAIIMMCQEQNVPLTFALGRRALGRACAKPVPVSLVGIFSCQGVETQFARLCELTAKARQTYRELVAAVSESCNTAP